MRLKLVALFVFTFTFSFAAAVFANEAPDCSHAVANPTSVWPVNHQFRSIGISQVTDADNDPVNISIQCISQDEPLNSNGDGNFVPDGDGVGTSTALIRAERKGNSNGRFYHINFTATDSQGASCNGAVNVTVSHDKEKPPVDEGKLYSSTLSTTQCASQPQNHPPVITSQAITQINENELYVYDVQATDPDGNTLTYSFGTAPTGMTINSQTGLINWQTNFSSAGVYAVVVRVQDSYGATAEQSFQIEVVNVNHPPQITSTSESTILVDKPYSYPVIATDPDNDVLHYELTTAPSGMIINAVTGKIDWTPDDSQLGLQNITVQVSDTYGATAIQSYTVFVSTGYLNNNHPPHIVSTPLLTATPNQPYSYTVFATDADHDTVTYALTGAPSGMQINPSTGLISWTPTTQQSGQQRIVVTATDTKGASDTQAYYIDVATVANQPPQFISSPVTAATPNLIYLYFAVATDPENELVTYSLGEAPDGMSIQQYSGLITWLPSLSDAGKRLTVEVLATDSHGAQALQHYDIQVGAELINHAPQFITQPELITMNDVLYTYLSEATDSDNNDQLSYSLATSPEGAIVNSANGDMAWMPDNRYVITSTGDNKNCRVQDAQQQFSLASDLIITNMALTATGVSATLKNRGAIAVNGNVTVNFYEDDGNDQDNIEGRLLGTASINALAIGAEQQLSVNTNVALIKADVIAVVTTDAAVQECYLTNNKTRTALFDLKVSDVAGASDRQRYLVNVLARNHSPYFAPATDSDSTYTGSDFQYLANAIDTDANDGLIYKLIGVVPSGVAIDKYTGKITWVPASNQTGNFVITVQVIDSAQATATFSLAVKVEINNPPDITTTPTTTVNEKLNYQYDANAIDPDANDSQLWSLNSPSEFSINAATGLVTGTNLSKYRVGPATADSSCLKPPFISAGFNPVEKWHWDGVKSVAGKEAYQNTFGPVTVGQLDDDNGDHKIDNNDIPDVVFVAGLAGDNLAQGNNFLVAVSGATGHEIWAVPSSASMAATVALGDIDNDGYLELVVPNYNRSRILAYNNNGTLLWDKPHSLLPVSPTDYFNSTGGVSLADLNHDGKVEVIYGSAVYNGIDGTKKWESLVGYTGGLGTWGYTSIAADLDRSGDMEVIAGRTVFRASDGAILWAWNDESTTDGFNAIGNFDSDSDPEIVYVSAGSVYVLDYATRKLLWKVVGAVDGNGGPPTIGDFNGDGKPDIGVAGASRYAAIGNDGTILWTTPTEDLSSSATGSSLFDFEGDGRVEVLYADEFYFRIYDGLTGATLYERPNSSVTRAEYPVVADIDNDGQAEILVGSNKLLGRSQASMGVLALEAGPGSVWAPTRNLWNQHAYHITNINDNGSIPTNEAHSWLTNNTYRLNSFLTGASTNILKLPDFRIGVAQITPSGSNYNILFNVTNRGLVTSPATTLKVYQGDSAQGQFLGSISIPSLSVNQTIVATLSGASILPNGNPYIYAIIDPDDAVEECHSDNNQSTTPLLNVTVVDRGGLSDSQLFAMGVGDTNDAPTIESIPVDTVSAGEIWQYAVQVNDPDIGDGFTYALTGTVPKGMQVYHNGVIHWRTLSTDAGTYNFGVTVTDLRGLSVSQAIKLTVKSVANNYPVFTTQPGNITIMSGIPFTYDVDATDADGDTITYSAVGMPTLPSGFQIGNQTGLIQWTPTASQAGTYKIALRATDSKGATAIQYTTLTVIANHPPVINSLPIPVAVPSTIYAYAVLATDADNDSLTYTLTTAPSGMTISSAGVITWNVPSNILGNVNVTVRVSDGRDAATQSWVINVATTPIINHAPKINSTPILGVETNASYSYQAVATDADNDTLVWLLAIAPTGMTIDAATGYVHWNADVPVGSYFASVQVIDSKGASTTQSWFINVYDNNAPRFVSVPVIKMVAGETYFYDANAIDPNNDPITYSLVQSAPRMTIDANNGVITWATNDDEAGVYTIELKVTDDNNLSSTQLFNLEVLPPVNLPPVIGSTPSTVAAVGFPYSYQVTATDPENKPLAYSLLNAPSGMTMSASGLISWTPSATQTGAQVIIVGVSDGVNITQQPFTVTVSAAPAPLAVSVGLTPGNVLLGQSILIDADVTGGLKPYTVTLRVDGVQQTIDANYRVNYTATTAGTHAIVINVVDALNQTMTFNGGFVAYSQGDTTLPIINIDKPVDDTAKISAPTAINISVNDQTLAQWRLTVRKPGETNEGQLLAAGTTTINNQSVADFDPTLRLNGMYELVLQAWDVAGNYAITGKRVIVDGNMKVGNFAFTVEDINIPMLGIPVSIKRTYDNRQRHDNLDFGYGWSLDYQNVRIDESREPSMGWYTTTERHNFLINSSAVSINATCVRSTGNKKVTVTLPDGKVEIFKVHAKNNSGGLASMDDPDCYMVASNYLSLEFTAEDNTSSTLTSADGEGLTLAGSNLTNDIVDNLPAEITDYRLTTRDGMIYDLTQGVGIKTVTDPNGNKLTYSSTGITHSAGQSLKFVRDAQGRITSITNPSTSNSVLARYTYDAAGNLISAYDQLGARTQYTFNTDHSLLEIKDPLNRRLVNNIYDDDGRLIAQEDNEGNRTDFNHDLDGREEMITDRNGNITQVFYDERGNVINQIDALHHITSYTFDAHDNQLSKTDALHHTTSSTFNVKNDQLTETDAKNNTTTFTYNSKGQELTITDKLGKTYTNTYDTAGNLLSITDPTNHTMNSTVAANGTLTQIKDVMNNATNFTYDSKGNKATETDALNRTTTFTYDANNNVKTESKTRTQNATTVTQTTTYTYDAKNRVIQTTNALGHITKTEYDLAGNETAQIDAKGNRTEFVYDAYKRLTQTKYADGTTELKDYDREGNVISETDRAGRTTTYEYDALKRKVKTVHSNNSYATTEYDAVGNVTAEVDENGNRTTHEYDELNRKIATINALHNRTTFEYDNEGRLVKQTDANNHVMQYVYNALGQKTKTIFHDGSTQQDGLDALGRKTSKIDEANVITQMGYDALGRLTSVTDAQNNTTTYGYDEVGNKISQTDAEGRITKWDYDSLGRVTKRTLPLGQFETFTYDANGNELTHVDFKGQTTTSTYNVNNQLTQKTFADGSSESFTYTVNGQVETVTQTKNNLSQVTRYEYDNRDRLIKETKPTGDKLEYTYDNVGNKTQVKLTKASGGIQTTTTTYDELNREKTVIDNGTTQYTYDNVGNQQSVTYPNGNSQNYTFDTKNRLTQMQTKQGATLSDQYDYTLEPTGRRTKLVELSGRTTDFTYDKVGNRKTEITNAVTTQYSYDANDRILTAGNISYTYDNNGNTLTENGSTPKTFSYNAQNELTSVTQGAGSATFEYDANGFRTFKTTGGITTQFITDNNRDYSQVLAEVENGTTKAQYTYGNDLISQNRSGANSYYLYDALGSVKALSDASGNITDKYNYTAFGKDLNHSGSTANSYKFAGEQYDSALDNYYLRARYYNQNIGRFTSMDSYQGNGSDPITLHKYLYAGVNPISYTDPSGHDFNLASTLTALNVGARLITIGGTAYSVNKFFTSNESLGDRSKALAVDLLITYLPLGTLTSYMKIAGLKFVAVQSKVVYRYMSKAELEAVQLFKRLRGERQGVTYFTDDAYDVAKTAKSKLSLDEVPEVRVKVEIKNNPNTVARNPVKPANNELGGGTEKFTAEDVYVEILEVLHLK